VALVFRWRFQFSVRALLVLVFVVAAPCSWLAAEMRNAKRQRESADAIRKLADDGGRAGIFRELTIAYDFERDQAWLYDKLPYAPGPTWPSAVLGYDFFRRVEFVDVGTVRTTVRDEDLRAVQDFPRLRVLFIGGPGITNAAVEHLNGLNRLEMLGIVDSEVTDSGIARLAELRLPSLRALSIDEAKVTPAVIDSIASMPGMTHLSLWKIKIDDRGIERLKALPRLESLELCQISLTDEGLKRIAELPNLKELSLDSTKFSGAGLRYLAASPKLERFALANTNTSDADLESLTALTNLKELKLNDTRVSDVGMKYVAAFSNLEHLVLRGTTVSDAGLSDLARLKRLRFLDLYTTPVTTAGMEKLQQELPNCHIQK
jgi:hypothetical protein